MTPGKYDLDLYRGDSYGWRVILWDDDDKTVPTDLTGAVVEAEFRDKPGGAAIVNFETSITLPNVIDVRFTAELWENAPCKGVWDLEITFPGGNVMTPLAGRVTVAADITNSTPNEPVGAAFAGRLRRAS